MIKRGDILKFKGCPDYVAMATEDSADDPLVRVEFLLPHDGGKALWPVKDSFVVGHDRVDKD